MSDENSDALRAAMAAAIAAKNFELRWEDIAKSAGVKRATAFRRKELHAEWGEACRAHGVEAARAADVSKKARDTAETKRDLQRKVSVMATHLEAMVSLVAMKETQIGALERQLKGAAKVVTLPTQS